VQAASESQGTPGLHTKLVYVNNGGTTAICAASQGAESRRSFRSVGWDEWKENFLGSYQPTPIAFGAVSALCSVPAFCCPVIKLLGSCISGKAAAAPSRAAPSQLSKGYIRSLLHEFLHKPQRCEGQHGSTAAQTSSRPIHCRNIPSSLHKHQMRGRYGRTGGKSEGHSLGPLSRPDKRVRHQHFRHGNCMISIVKCIRRLASRPLF
jgi:hypothetical protein